MEWEDTLTGRPEGDGMERAFCEGCADFTLMSPRGNDLFIDFVKQNTFVHVNEEGTEAAAVTTVGVGSRVPPFDPLRQALRVRHPGAFERHNPLHGQSRRPDHPELNRRTRTRAVASFRIVYKRRRSTTPSRGSRTSQGSRPPLPALASEAIRPSSHRLRVILDRAPDRASIGARALPPPWCAHRSRLVLVLGRSPGPEEHLGLPAAPPPRTDFPAHESPFLHSRAHTHRRRHTTRGTRSVAHRADPVGAWRRSYMPHHSGSDAMIGAIVVLDHAPRSWSAKEVAQLGDVAGIVMAEIELRRERFGRERAVAEHREE